MGCGVTYQDLADLIEDAGYRVALPGQQNVALPAFTINPLGINLMAEFPQIAFEICSVSARVTLDQNNPANWDTARLMMYDLLRAFKGTQFAFDGEIEVESDLETDPPSIAYRMVVQFPGESICAPAVPDEPEEAA